MQCRNQHILRTLPTEIDTSSYKTGLGSAYPSLFMAQFEPPQQAILMLLKKKKQSILYVSVGVYEFGGL